MTRSLSSIAGFLLLAPPALAQPLLEQTRWANPGYCNEVEARLLEEFQTLVSDPWERAFDPLHRALLPAATEDTSSACKQRVESFGSRQEGQANDGVHSWLLVAGCKEAVCGTLDGFESNLQTPWLSGEYDFNHNIVDLQGAAPERLEEQACARDDALPLAPTLADPRDVGRFVPRERQSTVIAAPEGGGRLQAVPRERKQELPCVRKTGEWWLHVEISPVVHLRRQLRKLWYEPGAWPAWKESVADGLLCVYGPLVVDTGHDKTEIHPSQLYWWQESTPGPTVLPGNSALLVLQDASSRYNKDHNFVLEKPFPENALWRPWAKGPVHGRFRIPFRFRAGEAPTFTLAPYFEPWKKDLENCLARKEEKRPCGQLQLGPAQARWLKPAAPDGLEVKVEFVCRDDSAAVPELKGIVAVEARTGSDREWREGGLALRLLDSRLSEPRPFLAAGWERARNWKWTPVPDAQAKNLRTSLLQATGWPADAVTLGTVRALTRARLGVGGLRLGPEEVELELASRQPRAAVRLAPCLADTDLAGGDTVVAHDARGFEVRLSPGPLRCLTASLTWPIAPGATIAAAVSPTTPVESSKLWSHALFAPGGKENRANWEDEFAMAAALSCRQLAGTWDSDREAEAANLSRRLAEDGVLTGDDLSFTVDGIRKRCGGQP